MEGSGDGAPGPSPRAFQRSRWGPWKPHLLLSSDHTQDSDLNGDLTLCLLPVLKQLTQDPRANTLFHARLL